MENIEKKCSCSCGTIDENKKKLLEVIASCEGDKSQLMKVLNAAQEIYGYIPLHAQKTISEELDICNSALHIPEIATAWSVRFIVTVPSSLIGTSL